MPKEEAMEIHLRKALARDAPAILACVREAYAPYVERMGKEPGPMREDYTEVIARAQVHVAVDKEGGLAGVLVLELTADGFCLDNIAVRPLFHGKGVGRELLTLAEGEALRQGHSSLYLYTNECMHENQVLYARNGYVEYRRAVVKGYARIFYRKSLAGE